MSELIKGCGPAMSVTSPAECLRVGGGVFLGLGIVTLLLHSLHPSPEYGLFLIAPFGATAVLIFAVPTSPLAQPWSALVGNTAAALVGVFVVRALPDSAYQVPCAVGLAIVTMFALRAVHPPAGAIAMSVPIYPSLSETFGYGFALAPVAAGTFALVLIGMLFGFLSRRSYPSNIVLTPRDGSGPESAIALDEEALTEILDRYRQSLNIQARDLARLIGAAEQEISAEKSGKITASDLMTTDLICVGADDPLTKVAAIFRVHKVSAIPVVDSRGHFQGLVQPGNVISGSAFSSWIAAASNIRKIIRPSGAALANRVGDVMDVHCPTASPHTHISLLLPILAEKGVRSVPILEGGRIVGIVTKTDLLSNLASLCVGHSG